jgi:hypothetical protein
MGALNDKMTALADKIREKHIVYPYKMNIDKMIEPNNPNAADFLVRGDGTGYAAGGNFWWDASGTIHADPMSFVISEQSVGMLLASF